MSAPIEFVLWGKPTASAAHETILRTMNGACTGPITSESEAETLKRWLIGKGCAAVRIQRLDLAQCPSELWGKA